MSIERMMSVAYPNFYLLNITYEKIRNVCVFIWILNVIKIIIMLLLLTTDVRLDILLAVSDLFILIIYVFVVSSLMTSSIYLYKTMSYTCNRSLTGRTVFFLQQEVYLTRFFLHSLNLNIYRKGFRICCNNRRNLNGIFNMVNVSLFKFLIPSSISYCTSLRLQYDILRGTICLNISAITLLLYTYSTKYFSL
jgi:hypothetical protein